MLVIRTKHFWLGSAPARRSGHGIMRVQLLMAQSAERELGMAWLWPERLDIEVPAAVCSAATIMGALGRIPVETRIAPKSENWQLSPHRRGVGELCASSRRVFCSSPGRHRRALTTRLGFVHGEFPVHESKSRRQSTSVPPRRAAKHSATRRAKLTDAAPVRGELPVLTLRRDSSLNRYSAERTHDRSGTAHSRWHLDIEPLWP